MKRSTVWRLVVLSCAGFWLAVGTGCAQHVKSEREQEATRAAIIGAAEGQALSNAQALYPVQKAQAAKAKIYKGYGVEVSVSGNWITVDGKPAALVEKNEHATAVQSGLFIVTVYKNGKVALMKEGVFVGWLKKVK
ncbi:UNVERIFIED_CONTAM: hypothetical protein RF648_19145 [Kocuria sp. CPCC 205274]